MKRFAGAALAALTVAGLALLALGHLWRNGWPSAIPPLSGGCGCWRRPWSCCRDCGGSAGAGWRSSPGWRCWCRHGQTALAVRGSACGQGALLLYQKNVLYSGGDRAALVADIRASRADIVTLQETVAADAAMFAALADDYPTQWHCRSNAIGDCRGIVAAPDGSGQRRLRSGPQLGDTAAGHSRSG